MGSYSFVFPYIFLTDSLLVISRTYDLLDLIISTNDIFSLIFMHIN